MALPPTLLTRLLSAADQEPAALIRALRDAGCISSPTAKDPALAKLIADTLAVAKAHPPHPGPTQADLLAQALVTSGSLTPRGRRFAAGNTDSGVEIQTGRKVIIGLLALGAILQGWSVMQGTALRVGPMWVAMLAFGVSLLLAATAAFQQSRLQIVLYRVSGLLGFAFSLGVGFTGQSRFQPIVPALVGIALGTAILIWLWREAARAGIDHVAD